MKIFSHLKSDWFRYGFETLAVVVGIMIAFALESWGDEQKVKQEEHEILINMLSDLKDAKEQSSELIATELLSRAYILTALDPPNSGATLAEDFYTDSIIYDVLWNVTMEVPVIHSYSDIKNTGKSGLITNEQIRQRFANLSLSIKNLQNQIDDRLRVQQLRIDEISVTDLNYVRLISFRNPELTAENEAANDYQSLLADQRIRNLLAIKLNLSNSVIMYRKGLETEIKSLIALLEEEIDQNI